VEEDLARLARTGGLPTQGPQRLTYGGDSDRETSVALPCGARLELLAEPLKDQAHWQALRDRVAAGELIERRLCLGSGESSLHPAGEAVAFDYLPDQRVSRVFGPAWQLVVIGASDITHFLAPLAMSLGYRVLVCDPRPEARLAIAGLVLTPGMPDEVAARHADHPRCALVALTHDPRLDDMALMQALTGRAFYVGALGSRANQARRRERLSSLGLSEAQVGRLRGPVGLAIGARTPAEIAVAIAAELIAVRNLRPA
jgi:xanthine dehydrogenase accessory factor